MMKNTIIKNGLLALFSGVVFGGILPASNPVTLNPSPFWQSTANAAPESGLRPVLLVGNAVSGSVTILDGQTFDALGSVNVIPDLAQRLAAIDADFVHKVIYQTILNEQLLKHFEPELGHRFVDDVFTSPDGNILYVSRSNLGDVAAFDLRSPDHPMLWRTDLPFFKADHATLSPDGTKIVVSVSVAKEADILDTATGAIIGSFETGLLPHQNDYSADGKYIYNGSLGILTLPHALDGLKGPRLLTVVDASTFQIVRTYSFPEGIRPSVFTRDNKTMYAQQSYQNGLIKFDLVSGTVVNSIVEPLSAFAQANYPTPDDYPHNSAHHGLAMSPQEDKLCDAGTIDNTVSIISTKDLSVLSVTDVGMVPYWATTSGDGKYCLVSLSGDNAIAVISFDTGKQVKKVPVGRFPQRNRLGAINTQNIELLDKDVQ